MEELLDSMRLAEQMASLSIINSTRGKSSIFRQDVNPNAKPNYEEHPTEKNQYVPPKKLLMYLARMGSFTSRPKIEPVDHNDETFNIPDDLVDDLFLAWIKEQQGPEPRPILARQYRNASGRGKAAPEEKPIRIFQWNILAQALGTHADNFVRCPAGALNWNYRRFKILEEILIYEPDIICLQEVDHYRFLERSLKTQGYEGYFIPKPDSPCIYLPENNGPDGCAVFYKKDRFEKIGYFTKVLEVWKVQSNQVAALLLLREKISRKELVVVSTHLKARKGALLSSLRNEQGYDILQFLEKHREGRSAVVCGDFNADPEEPVYNIMTDEDSNLKSAYAILNDGEEPPYSTWKIRGDGETKNNLDYIFFTSPQLIMEGGLDAPSEEQIGPNRVPSLSYPSDHFSLICDFSFASKKTETPNFSFKSRQ